MQNEKLLHHSAHYLTQLASEPTIESYENAVNRAFADYEALLKDYFWSLGLISAVEKHLYVGDGSGQQQNTPARSLQPRC